MPKEQGQPSLVELRVKEEKLQNSLAKADFVELTFSSSRYVNRLEDVIEKTPEKVMSRYTGQLVRVQEARQEADLRAFDIKESIKSKATPKIEADLAAVQACIRLLDETPRLIGIWKDYQEERTGAENYVTRIEERVQAGLDPSALERAKARLTEVESRVENDPELVRAKEAYLASLQDGQKKPTVPAAAEREENQPQKEQESLPSLKIDRSASTVQVGDGEPAKITKIQMAVLVKLAKNLDEPIKSRELSKILRNAGSHSGTGAIVFINVLREKLGDSIEDPKIITMEHSKSNAKYQLRASSVEFVGQSERSNIAKESTKLFEVTLPDRQIIEIRGRIFRETLESLTQTSEENPIQTDNLCRKVYGNFNETYRKRIVAAINELRVKISPYDWRILQSVDLGERAKGKLGKYYLEKSEPKKGKGVLVKPTPPGDDKQPSIGTQDAASTSTLTDEATASQQASTESILPEIKDLLPTQEEMALLITVYSLRRDIVRKHDLPEIPDEIIDSVLKRFEGRLNYASEDLAVLRTRTYEKFKAIVQSDRINEIYDQVEDEDAKKLIIYFLDVDPEHQLKALGDALLSPSESYWQTQSGRVIAHWKGINGNTHTEKPSRTTNANPKPIVRQVSKGIGTEQGQSLKHDATTQQVTEVKPAAQPVPVPTDAITHKEDKVHTIEQRFPGIADIVVQILNEIEPHLKSKTRKLTVPQISRTFKVKAKFIDNKIDNGYVTGEKGRDHLPVFGEDQIAMLVFLKRNGNGLSPAEVKALKKIIAGEVKKRQENKKVAK